MVSLKYENRMALVETATAAQPARDNAQDQAVRDSVGRIERSLEAFMAVRETGGRAMIPRFVVCDAELIIGRHRVSLTPLERDTLKLLCERQPHFVSRQAVAVNLWRGQFPADPDDSVRLIIHALRGKIEGTRLDIELHRSLGWRLNGEIKMVT